MAKEQLGDANDNKEKSTSRLWGVPASAVNYAEGVNSKRWSCRGCGRRQPVHCGSFFERLSE